MIRRAARSRSGITLTEILISILILGIGVISLAVLFPLGLVRLRNAQRLSRGAYLVESAAADLGSRNMLSQRSFFGSPYISPWYSSPRAGDYNPWLVDTPAYGFDWGDPTTTPTTYYGVYRPLGPGLPVAYDPLWRCVTGSYPSTPYSTVTSPVEGRFADGTGYLRPDPNPLGGPSAASGHGLQRLSNFQASLPAASSGVLSFPHTLTSIPQLILNNRAVLEAFVSPEDLVLQDPEGVYLDPGSGLRVTNPSPVLPSDVYPNNSATYDWRYTWFFTGQQSEASNGTVFDGEIVICENRPFGVDAAAGPFGATTQVAGETVVEAVWGYSSAPGFTFPSSSLGYGSLAANRSVVLRWPATMPDPDVRVGGWIADVTYERNQTAVASGRFPFIYPGQRCYWYQVAKKTDPVDDPGFSGDPGGVRYRRMTVWTTTPLRAMSLLDFSGTTPNPYHVEAALVMPSVVNVYPRTVYTR